MTTDELVLLLADRGLEVVVRPDGTPALAGRTSLVTPALLAVLRWHRSALIERARRVPAPVETAKARPREWLFPAGTVLGESAELAEKYGVADRDLHPGLATHWRYQGESDWKETRR